jgi:hypothetical protein
MLTLSFQLLCFCPCECNEAVEKIQKLFFLVVGDRKRAEVGRFLIRGESNFDRSGERRERKFFPFALKLLDAD